MASKETRNEPQWVTPSSNQDVPPDYETIGTIFGYALMVLSWVLIICTFPFSMCVCLKVSKSKMAFLYVLSRKFENRRRIRESRH